MRKLYESAFYFWVISRIVIMGILIYGLYEAFNSEFRMTDEAMYWNGATAVYVFVLFLILIKADENVKPLRVIAGVLSLVLAAILLYLFSLNFSYDKYYLLVFFAVWLIGLGLFDVLRVQRAVQVISIANQADEEKPAE